MKLSRKKLFNSIIFAAGQLLLLLAVTEATTAQTANPNASATPATPKRTKITSERGIAPVVPAMFAPILTGGLLDSVLVRNQPVSAVLELRATEPRPGSGAPAVRRVVTRIWRDGAGRTRREQLVYPNGAVPSPNDAAAVATIYDPVGGWSYTLDLTRRVAAKFKLPPVPAAPVVPNGQSPLIKILRNETAANGTSTTTVYPLAAPQVVSLGSQTIAGVAATGSRMMINIPVGAVGNTTPVITIYEAWLATDLQMLVKCSVITPPGSELTLTTTALSRTEPSAALFQIPAGFTVSEMGVRRDDLPPPH